LRDVIAILPRIQRYQKVFFTIATKNSIARVTVRQNCDATRKIEVARDGFQSGFARSHDPREISRTRRAIARDKNFLFDPRA